MLSRSRATRRLVTVALSLVSAKSLLIPCVARAQSAQNGASAQPSGGRTTSTDRTTLVTVNPLGLVFGAVSAEAERALSATRSAAVALTMYRPGGGYRYGSIEGKYRVRPDNGAGHALAGAYAAATVGATYVSATTRGTDVADCSSVDVCDEQDTGTSTALTAGLELGYQWLLGTDQRVGVAAGVGAKRLVYLGHGLAGASVALPSARLAVGYTF